MESTNNFLNWVDIKNFKSIKDLRLDCKRVNIFIGKPNVGKSNILEGLGLLGADYYDGSFMNGAVRYKNIKQLFYDSDVTKRIQIKSNLDDIQVIRDEQVINNDASYYFFSDLFENNNGKTEEAMSDLIKKTKFNYNFGSDGIFLNYSKLNVRFNIEKKTKIKKYDYVNIDKFDSLFSDFLLPPDGRNLFAVVDQQTNLKEEFGKLFAQQKLEFVLSKDEQSFELQKRDGFYAYKYPFFSIADTFRRFMFYVTAIESNKNSVIVFEEPEVHSFPPYTQELAYRMIYDEDNQYFISTHSPYMLHPFIEKMDYSDLNVFITYYHNYQTHVRALREDELVDILDYSTNVFFNLNKFEPDASTNSAIS